MVVTITIAITITTAWVAVRITITAATIIKRARTHPDTHFACTHLQDEKMEAQWVKGTFSLASCLNQPSWPWLRFLQDGRERGPCELTLEKTFFPPRPLNPMGWTEFPKRAPALSVLFRAHLSFPFLMTPTRWPCKAVGGQGWNSTCVGDPL